MTVSWSTVVSLIVTLVTIVVYVSMVAIMVIVSMVTIVVVVSMFVSDHGFLCYEEEV